MKKSLFFIIIIVMAVIQVTLLDLFKIFHVKPDLLLLGAVGASIIFELRWALIFSAFAGILKGVLSPVTFGTDVLLFVFLSFLIFKICKKISIDNNFMRMVLIFIAALVYNIIVGSINVTSGTQIPTGIFFRIIILGPLYTALILPLLFNLIRPIYRFE